MNLQRNPTHQRHAIYSVLVDGNWPLIQQAHRDWMWEPQCQDVWAQIEQAAMGGAPLNPDGIKNWVMAGPLHQNRKAAIVATITECCDRGPVIYNAQALPEILQENHKGHITHTLMKRLTQEGSTAEMREAAIAEAHKALTVAAGGYETKTVGEVADKFMDDLQSGAQSELVQKSIILHDPHLREMFRGRIWPVPYVIGAREKFRKTQTLINLLNHMGGMGRPGIFFSFEDSPETVAMKSLAIQYQIPYELLASGEIAKDRLAELRKRAYGLHGRNITIDPKGYRPEQWAKQVRMQCLSTRVEWVAMDFLQAMNYDRRFEVHELSAIGKVIRELSKEFCIPFITLAQANDNTEDKESGEVKLHIGNLKGSGAIKEDARFIAMIDGVASDGTLNWKCVKNSFGPLFRKRVSYDPPSGKIVNVSNYSEN